MSDTDSAAPFAEGALLTLPDGLSLMRLAATCTEDERHLAHEVAALYDDGPNAISAYIAQPVHPPRGEPTTDLAGIVRGGHREAPPVAPRTRKASVEDGRSRSRMLGRERPLYCEAYSGIARIHRLPGRKLLVWDEGIWPLRPRDLRLAAALLSPVVDAGGEYQGLLYMVRPSPNAEFGGRLFLRL